MLGIGPRASYMLLESNFLVALYLEMLFSSLFSSDRSGSFVVLCVYMLLYVCMFETVGLACLVFVGSFPSVSSSALVIPPSP